MNISKLILLFSIIIFSNCVFAQKSLNLAKLLKNNKAHVYNRNVIETDTIHGIVKLDEQKGEGLVWVDKITFTTGTIDIDLKGQDVFQKSFLGIAFHGSNDSTYEAIYFRPFNFNAKDSVRRIHAVQYISHPEYNWKRLRDEKNGIFEKEIFPKTNPNEWFLATIKVTEKQTTVFVNNSKTPSLVIDRINNKKAGAFGLWVGDGAGGEFKNLMITTKK